MNVFLLIISRLCFITYLIGHCFGFIFVPGYEFDKHREDVNLTYIVTMKNKLLPLLWQVLTQRLFGVNNGEFDDK